MASPRTEAQIDAIGDSPLVPIKVQSPLSSLARSAT
jgi:hypothetical protein